LLADVAKDLGISGQSISTWRRQDRIDRGLVPGLSSAEKAELGAAKRRIAALETERRCCVPPTWGAPSSGLDPAQIAKASSSKASATRRLIGCSTVNS
jgi:hypothetical protein